MHEPLKAEDEFEMFVGRLVELGKDKEERMEGREGRWRDDCKEGTAADAADMHVHVHLLVKWRVIPRDHQDKMRTKMMMTKKKKK